MRKLSKRDEVNENFYKLSSELFENSMKTFKKISASLVLENSGWGD